MFGSPFEYAHDWKAHNRLTIARKVRLFNNLLLKVGKACELRKFGSIIDYDCKEATLQQDLAQVTILINLQRQVKTAMDAVNALCDATKPPSALMKVNAQLIRRASKMEVCKEAKALSEIFREFFSGERPNSSRKCLLCERGDKKQSAPKCNCGYQVKSIKSRWSHVLADLLKDSGYLLKHVANTDVTIPTPVALTTSLACRSPSRTK